MTIIFVRSKLKHVVQAETSGSVVSFRDSRNPSAVLGNA